MERARVVVIGGGLTGLTAAHDLTRPGPAAAGVLVLERSGRTGGALSTVRAGSCLLEEGADSFVRSKPAGLAFASRLGLEAQFQGVRSTGTPTLLASRGRLRPLPRGLHVFVPGRLLPFLASDLLSVPGRLRALADLVLPSGAPASDESLASFVRRRFGQELLERLARPLAAGIYSGDPEELSVEATFPRLAAWERRGGSVIRALRAERRAGREPDSAGPRSSLFVTLRDGMGTFPAAIARSLPDGTVRTGSTVRSLARSAGGWTIGTGEGSLEAERVLLAVPAGEAAALLDGVDASLAGELRRIPLRSCATVSLCWPRDAVPELPEANGFLRSSSDGSAVLACTFVSRKYEGRCEPDRVLVRVFVGGPHGQEAARDADRALAAAVAELRAVLGIERPPELSRVALYPDGLPVFRPGHAAAVSRIEAALERLPGLSIAGNFLGGVGISDCVESARRAAARLAVQSPER